MVVGHQGPRSESRGQQPVEFGDPRLNDQSNYQCREALSSLNPED